ncbi:MAG TPA: sn-glycerol-3-phosphate ABC transporter ATP-binding protein UgpC [Streptosporangiaceae bacterium]|nr:sn-glycerol-3-phosphate ABC transporter ATP-binding protein UgpC [Streptosporangiaceae bacterium]
MAEVSFHEVTKVFPNGTTAVDALTCTIADGEFMVLVGPSGCGKTTALRMVAGLEEPTSGAIAIGGNVVNGVSPQDRDIAMVFQSYALYPHKSVLENLAFGLRQRKMPTAEIEERVREVSSLLTLNELLDRKPAQLSGGQRQRVAMGRALARRPRVYLLDEPLSNLDAQLRTQLRADLKQLHQRFSTTTIYVTHDQVEAMTLGERIGVMSNGKLLQLGTPQEIYRHPASVFVAGFIGSPPMNLLSASATDGRVNAGDLVLEVSGAPSGEMVVGVRPEALRLITGATKEQTMQMRVEVVELLGHETIVYGSIRGQRVATASTGAGIPSLPSDRAIVIARLDARRQPAVGETITLGISLEDVHLFDAKSGEPVARPAPLPSRHLAGS